MQQQWEGMGSRLAGALVVALVVASLAGLPMPTAQAEGDLCAGDPVFQIGSDTLSVVIQIPSSALASVTSANPVIVQITAPQGVTALQVSYSGVVPELAQFQWTQQQNANSGSYTIPVKVSAPAPGGSGTYPVYVTATSSLDSVSTQGVSGTSINFSVKTRK